MKGRSKKYYLFILLICAAGLLQAQTITPDLQDLKKWNAFNRLAEAVNEDDKKAVRLNEMPNDGYMILKGIDFSNGTIELYIKGADKQGQSFVGIVFHGQDEKTYDAIYFRPFNFMNVDTMRRARAVQYISMPGYPWEKLRETFPGKYENRVNPVPDPNGWFHATIVVKGKIVSVFVNHSEKPSLQVEKLTNTTNGGIALWVGNNSAGSFANLKISPGN
jgi:Domain of Unknown Function (DUF1080)